MPLLFPKRTDKVTKHQHGGNVSVPVYGTYTYKEAQQAPYNSASLLAKYEGAGAAY